MNHRNSLHVLTLGLSDSAATLVAAEAHAFADAINAAIPNADLHTDPPPEWIVELLTSPTATTLADVNADLFHQLCFKEGRHRDKVLVVCTPQHALARAALAGSPDALWGAAFEGGPLGIVYGNHERFLIWHEILHLYGASDCYDLPDRGPTCNHPRCIMQYEPTAATTGPGLVICDANLSAVMRYVLGDLAHG